MDTTKYKNIIQNIFDDNKEFRDPNKPENTAYYSAIWKIHNKALTHWVEECGGEYLLDSMRGRLKGMIIDLVLYEINSEKDFLHIVKLKTMIQKECDLMDRIMTAFMETERDERTT